MTDNKKQVKDQQPATIDENNNNVQIGKIEKSKFGKIKYISIVNEMEKSYIDYAMSVIVSRALPDVRDGLKPVHRRILYSMYKTGIHARSGYKKSARIVGDVLGKYHPHGDAPVYGALVRLAQDFNMRYPLIDGQGNFGSIDGDSPAAMRYTEARLEKISDELLIDLDKNTVPMVDNFDGSLKEPDVLPGKLPNLLLAGSEGIAVGMATKIPPHNLTEVCKAIIAMIHKGDSETSHGLKYEEKTSKKKTKTNEIQYDAQLANQLLSTSSEELAGKFKSEITTDEIMTHIKGPDFPTGGIIYNYKGIKEAYKTGKGRIIMRGKATIEEVKRSFEIIITEIPFQVNKAKLIKKIASLVRDKKIEGIKNVRDDSDRKGLQITVELKRSARPKVVLNKLFKYSRLQKSFPMNMVALNSERTPQLMNILQVLREYIAHRQLVVVRRSQYKLKEARDRAHILEGLLIALNNLDDVVETIKNSKDTPTAHDKLMKKFSLSDVQATAILEMQLKRLAALERQKIEEEFAEIQKTIKKLMSILTSSTHILDIVKDETEELIAVYGDKRKTKLIKGKVGEFNEEDLVPNERTVITLTESGYIKRLHPQAFRAQARGGKGAKGLEMKDEDVVHTMLSAETHDTLLFFTNKGRVFKLKAFEVPESKRQSKGKAIVNLLNLKSEEKVLSILTLDEENDRDKYITLVTKNGLVKKSAVDLYDNIRQSGIIAITLNDGDELVWGKITSGKDDIMLITHNGKSIRFSETEVKDSQRDTKGVKGITLKKGDYVVGVEALDPNVDKDKKSSLLVVTENGLGKRTKLKHYPKQKRSGLGVKVSSVTKKTGKIAAAKLVTDDHAEMVISTKMGTALKLKISKKSVPYLSRPTQGVILIKLRKTDQVVAVALTLEEIEQEE